tara:strand:+ start:105 stop:836 length:732 start_codon:yes stop_codon:yes gene_type:complete
MNKSFFFDGEVLHSRSFPKKHSFHYQYKSIYSKDVYCFLKKKYNYLSIFPLRYNFTQKIIDEEIINWFSYFIKIKSYDKNDIKIDLLKIPNIIGETFNPVCFWILKYKGQLKAYIAEVTNTFKEKKIYQIHNEGENIVTDQWISINKSMYVSPFSEKTGLYKFNINLSPVIIKIHEFDKEDQLEIITQLKGDLRKLSRKNLWIYTIRLLYNSLSVLPKIHIQALKLWLKKLKVFPHKGNGYAE